MAARVLPARFHASHRNVLLWRSLVGVTEMAETASYTETVPQRGSDTLVTRESYRALLMSRPSGPSQRI